MDKLKQKWQCKPLVVYTILMGDVEDPDLFVAEPIWKWQQTEAGKFVMNRSVEPPIWQRAIDEHSWGWKYSIIAYLTEQDETYFRLKYK